MLYLELETEYWKVNSVMAGKTVTFQLTCGYCYQGRTFGEKIDHPMLPRESLQKFPPGASHCQGQDESRGLPSLAVAIRQGLFSVSNSALINVLGSGWR